MNLRQVLLILRLRWWLVLSLLILVVGGALLYSLKYQPKRFVANTTLILDMKTDPLLSALAPGIAAPAYIATQAEILASERLSSRVVRMMGLAQNAAAVAQWREETEAKVPLEVYFGQLLQGGLQVKPGRGNQLLNITFNGADPNFAAAAANTFAKAYIDLSVELRNSPARENAGFYDDRLKQLRTELEAAQERVSEFQQRKGVMITNDRFDQESSRLAALEASLSAALAEQAAAVSIARNSGGDLSADVAQSGAVQEIRSQLAAAETRMSEASLTLGSNHPTRLQLDAQIKELRSQLGAATRRVGGSSASASRVSSQKVGELRALVEAQKRTVLNMRTVRDEGAFLLKELEAAQRTFDTVTQRRTQLSLESQADQAAARVLSPATAPLEPASPNVPKNMLVAVLLGLGLGIGVALAWELLDRRVRSEHDLSGVEGVPVLTVLSNRREKAHMVRRLPIAPSPPRLTMNDGVV
jgi:chain length determinant protein EpsF